MITNAQIAELLAAEAEQAKHPVQRPDKSPRQCGMDQITSTSTGALALLGRKAQASR